MPPDAALAGYAFRDARPGDEAGVQAVVGSILQEYGMSLELKGTDRDLVDIAASYQRPGGAFRVLADASGSIAGCGGLYPQDEREAEIRKMYLIPAMRGKGLGLTLLRNLVDIAREKGLERINLETKTVLREAIAMYQRFGFREIHLEHRTPRCDRAFELILSPPGHPSP